METEQETVKIRTIQGRIITLSVKSRTLTHISGTDKFGEEVILPLDEIDRMLPISTGGGNSWL